MKLRPTFALLALSLLALSLSLVQACHHHDHDDDDDGLVVVSSGFEIEPNDESASPHFLGVLRQGEAAIVEGHAEAGDVADPFADPFDGFAISLTQPTAIEFALFFDDDQGELDVWIYDPAIDDIALFFETDGSPEQGTFFVDHPVLDFQIVVFAFAGEADYRLEIGALAFHGASKSPAATWGGSVIEARDFPALERSSPPLLRRRAADAYLGRPLADSTQVELPFRIGTVLAFDEAEQVFELPVFSAPDGVPFAVLRERESRVANRE